MPDYKEFGAMEHKGWNEPATVQSYADNFATAAAQCVPAMVDAVNPAPGAKALDLCCGHGVVSAGLAEKGVNVTGLDFSAAMLKLARQAAPKVNFIEGDATDLPFHDNSFDIATMGFGMLHIPDQPKALQEIKRILRPGGRLAFSVWHGPEISDAFRIVFGAIAKHGDPNITLPPGPALHAFADKNIATNALLAAGFTDPSLQTVHSHWTVTDPLAPHEFFKQGTVRGAALLRAQPEANQTAICEAVIAAVKSDLGPKPPWTISIPAAIVSATA